MANITITVPDAAIPRLKRAVETNYERPDGLTDGQFYRWAVARLLEEFVRSFERNAAASDADAAGPIGAT